jgi:hypothetical protein
MDVANRAAATRRLDPARIEIGYAIRRFVEHDERPVFWGYFPAYDWVAFTWLFGDMNDLPFHFPQLCLDVKQ